MISKVDHNQNTTNSRQLNFVSRETVRFRVSRACGSSCWIVKWRIVVAAVPSIFDKDYIFHFNF